MSQCVRCKKGTLSEISACKTAMGEGGAPDEYAFYAYCMKCGSEFDFNNLTDEEKKAAIKFSQAH